MDLFGAELLAATPAHRVEEILPGRWLLQLAARPSDVCIDWDASTAVRDRCKAHLGLDASRPSRNAALFEG